MANPTVFPKLRGGPELTTRAQDSVDIVLRPLAQAVGATPIMGAPAPPWLAPGLQNGFINLTAGFVPAGYHRDALGYVWARAVLQSTPGAAAGTTLFELDPGYRPLFSLLFAVYGDAATLQFIVITPTGLIQNQVAMAAGTNIGFHVSFLAEQ